MVAHPCAVVTPRVFSSEKSHPFDTMNWQRRDAVLTDKGGNVVFEARGVEVPEAWSQRATDIVAAQYFRVVDGVRETSVMDVVGRVTATLAEWGMHDGYFDYEQSTVFEHELLHILLDQRAAFNSPVWYNVGVREHPQTSACFILAVEDSMPSILEWYRQEAMIFKGGSGAGVNLSKIRAKHAPLSNGGTASGPVSFMRVADTSAGAVKSGGGTRRAAKMCILNWDHPDIEEFITCKVEEEKKAAIFRTAGLDATIDGGVYAGVHFQNANHSVGVTDEFMALDSVLLNTIAMAAHDCGDPGLFFTDTINAWHTCPKSGPITSSNPCSEFVFLDNSACNLASINLLKFLTPDGHFATERFIHTCHVLITAMDILVDRSSYPTEKIAETSKNYRPLGLGYANLGATLMAMGIPYDSHEGREFAAEVTSTMTAAAYEQSARLAQVKGPFAGFERNADDMLTVIERHAAHAPTWESRALWQNTCEWGREYGFRNAQATLLAPTGTISFMMDCDTTGIEPCLGLVTRKKLVGGGEIDMLCNAFVDVLRGRGWADIDIDSAINYVTECGTFAGFTSGIWGNEVDDIARIFQCALGPDALPWQAHVKMVAAVQPHLSGSVSKTINMPASATVGDVHAAYRMAWELGLKTISIYRDGSKHVQPVNVTAPTSQSVPVPANAPIGPPVRRRLPDERPAITHKFEVNGHEGYVTVGVYDDGRPAELFIHMAKEGSTMGGLMDALGVALSLGLQYGVPLDAFTNKFKRMAFEPLGYTANPDIPQAQSVVDYLAKWLDARFSGEPTLPVVTLTPPVLELQALASTNGSHKGIWGDTPPCPECGNLTIRQGACCYCVACGTSSGCS